MASKSGLGAIAQNAVQNYTPKAFLTIAHFHLPPHEAPNLPTRPRPHDAPVSAYSNYSASGGISSGGGFGGGIDRGRLLGRRRLLRLGAVGGIVAIAVSNNGVSADQ